MLYCIADKSKLIMGLFSWSHSTADELLTPWVRSALIVAENFQHFHFVCNYDKTGRSVSNLWNQDFSASYSATSIFSNLHILIRPPDKSSTSELPKYDFFFYKFYKLGQLRQHCHSWKYWLNWKILYLSIQPLYLQILRR